MQQPTIMYGVGFPVSAYQAPDPSPWQEPGKWWPDPPQVLPQVTITPLPRAPDPLGTIEGSIRALKALGYDGINALRLLAICDWNGDIALNIYKECRSAKQWDVLKIAREVMGK